MTIYSLAMISHGVYFRVPFVSPVSIAFTTHLLRDEDRVDVALVESPTQPANPRGNLVEHHRLAPTIPLYDMHGRRCFTLESTARTNENKCVEMGIGYSGTAPGRACYLGARW